MISAIVEPDHAFAMVSTNDLSRLQAGGKAQEGIWGFTLEPSQPGQTRLIAHLRGGTPPTLGARLGRLFWEPAHFVMERGCCGPFGIWPRKLHRTTVTDVDLRTDRLAASPAMRQNLSEMMTDPRPYLRFSGSLRWLKLMNSR